MSDEQIVQDFAAAFVGHIRDLDEDVIHFRLSKAFNTGPGGLISVTVVARDGFDAAILEEQACFFARVTVLGMARERGDFGADVLLCGECGHPLELGHDCLASPIDN